MRTIKFRAWDESIRRMCEVVSLDFRSNQARVRWYESETKQGEYYELLHSDNLILMQFTGIVDKDGKEDYEGNIWEVEYRGKKYRFLREVVLDWEGYKFDFRCLNGDISPVHASVDEEGVIIGNIYQNEDLLKEAKC
jgi:uncharacterized phage protein (TIGR01671 family)